MKHAQKKQQINVVGRLYKKRSRERRNDNKMLEKWTVRFKANCSGSR
jgi:hypothetical protein